MSVETLLQGRYRIEKELGRGGFGIVYLARDQHLHSKPVVIKVLLDDSVSDPWFQKKFRQEIEALARIDHPGVVGALDVGETADGKPYLVMQFVDGVTLRSLISEEGMDLGRVANIMRQIGQALGAAHEKGVYHRDLKPENILVQSLGDGQEHVKLIDFGIAMVKDSQAAAGPQTTKLAGSFAYMAPEQFRGQASAASDIFSLGVIAYEMVTGRRPFTSESFYEFLEMQQQGVRIKPQDLRPSLPEAAQDVILRALSSEPANRYSRPQDFGESLARALEGAPLHSSLDPDAAPSLEMAYVLFMDMVGYSNLPTDRQSQAIHQLQEIVRSTSEFRRGQARGQLVSLPSGDGMALVFFHSPEAPAECAIEIARALRDHVQLQLRLGVHTGPVYRIADINTNRNVAGGGINLAQRVMDCGDAGHILVSKSVADVLSQLSRWAGCLHDLGEHKIKHGHRIHLFNLYTAEIGNPRWPQKLPSHKKWAVPALVSVAMLGVAAIVGVVVWPVLFPRPLTRFHERKATEPAQPVPQDRTQPSVPSPTPLLRTESPPKSPNGSSPTAPGSEPATAGKPVLVPQWPTFRGSTQRNGVTAVMGPRQPRVLWTAVVGGELRGSPTIGSDGTVYIGSLDRNLYAIRNGKVIWTFATGEAILATPIIDRAGTIRITTRSGERYSLNPEGQKISVEPSSGVETAISPDGQTYYCDKSALRCLDHAAWRVELGEEASTSPAVANNGDIYVGSADGTLHCLDRYGNARWTYRAAARITTPPAVTDSGDVIFGCVDRNLYCLRDGELRWKFATGGPIFSAPVVDRSGTIYFGSNDGNLYAVAALGQLVWKLQLGNEIHASPAFDRQGRLYIASIQHRVYCLSD